MRRNRFSVGGRLLVSALVSLSGIGLAAAVTAPPASAAGETATLGMPFNGKWAYSVATNATCGPASSQTSHPRCHEIYYGSDWSTDLYAGDGTAVNLRLSLNFTPTFVFVPVGDGACGHRVVFKVLNGSTPVAQLYFDHLKSEVNSSAEIKNGIPVGLVDQTCHVGYAHTHLEVKSLTGTPSCFQDYSTSTQTAGFDLKDGNNLGNLASGASGARQACSAAPPVNASSYAGHIVQWNGDTKAQKTSWVVGLDGHRNWISSTSMYNCLKSFGAPGPDNLPSTTLDQLPDQTGVAATCDRLSVNWTMSRGQSFSSSSGYALAFQGDGNLVVYGPGGKALWATFAGTAVRLVMQSDGNLVEYDAAGRAVWSSGTYGRGPSQLVMQPDGNLVIYNASRATWATYTTGGANQLGRPGGYIL